MTWVWPQLGRRKEQLARVAGQTFVCPRAQWWRKTASAWSHTRMPPAVMVIGMGRNLRQTLLMVLSNWEGWWPWHLAIPWYLVLPWHLVLLFALHISQFFLSVLTVRLLTSSCLLSVSGPSFLYFSVVALRPLSASPSSSSFLDLALLHLFQSIRVSFNQCHLWHLPVMLMTLLFYPPALPLH